MIPRDQAEYHSAKGASADLLSVLRNNTDTEYTVNLGNHTGHDFWLLYPNGTVVRKVSSSIIENGVPLIAFCETYSNTSDSTVIRDKLTATGGNIGHQTRIAGDIKRYNFTAEEISSWVRNEEIIYLSSLGYWVKFGSTYTLEELDKYAGNAKLLNEQFITSNPEMCYTERPVIVTKEGGEVFYYRSRFGTVLKLTAIASERSAALPIGMHSLVYTRVGEDPIVHSDHPPILRREQYIYHPGKADALRGGYIMYERYEDAVDDLAVKELESNELKEVDMLKEDLKQARRANDVKKSKLDLESARKKAETERIKADTEESKAERAAHIAFLESKIKDLEHRTKMEQNQSTSNLTSQKEGVERLVTIGKVGAAVAALGVLGKKMVDSFAVKSVAGIVGGTALGSVVGAVLGGLALLTSFF